MTDRPKLAQLVSARYEVGDGECWLWTGDLFRSGYGRLYDGAKRLRAHRASFVAFVGPIPSGVEVCHRCNNKACVNPEHLYLATHIQNVRDAMADGLIRKFKSATCRNGHQYTPENTRIRPGGARRACKECQRAHCRAYRERRKNAT